MVCTEQLGAKKPEDLAAILGNALDRYVRAVGKIHSQVLQVRNLLSKAQGIQRAMQTDFNKAAESGVTAKASAEPAVKKTTAKPAAPRSKTATTAKAPARGSRPEAGRLRYCSGREERCCGRQVRGLRGRGEGAVSDGGDTTPSCEPGARSSGGQIDHEPCAGCVPGVVTSPTERARRRQRQSEARAVVAAVAVVHDVDAYVVRCAVGARYARTVTTDSA
ncbi:hypothetical protein [Streptomyces prunicolor]|uniref:hypothetical protein n=1 Tax=Streptomyces prunicolor TaxID=67348 RepID=UPI0034347611